MVGLEPTKIQNPPVEAGDFLASSVPRGNLRASDAPFGTPPEEIAMFRVPSHAPSLRKAVFLIAVVAATGCSLNTDVMGPAVLIKVSGDAQSAAINTLFPGTLSVVVANQFGEPLAGETVNWRIVSGGGALSAATVQTDESGAASVSYTSGATTGSVVIEARVSGVPALTFNLTVT
jgi:hypothetical protein